jgi:hypothetical protein
MLTRGYTADDVIEVLREPGSTYIGTDGLPNVRGRTKSGRKIRVCYKVLGSVFRVITVVDPEEDDDAD